MCESHAKRSQSAAPAAVIAENRDHTADRARRELEASRNKYFDLYDLAPVGYLTLDAHGSILEANHTTETLLGVGQGQMLQQPVSRYLVQDDRAPFALRHRQLFETGADQLIELRLLKADGSFFWARLQASAALDGDGALVCLATLSDITWHKQAEEALRESEERFRAVLQQVATVSVQGYAPDGTTRYWNGASERIYGYTAQEAIGRNLLDLIIPPEMRDGVVQAIRQMAATGQPIPAAELSLMRKDGSRVAVYSSHAIIAGPGRAQELFCLDIDLTERKLAEDELRRAKESLESANRELEAALAREQQLARADVLTGVSNRLHFYECADQAFDAAVRDQRPLCVMLFDIDHFKRVNDTHGHATGDLMLKRIAQVARAQLAENDAIARYGGEEFAVLLPATDARQALAVAERIRRGIADIRVDTLKGRAAVTISLGITQCAAGDESVENAISRADEAMYAAKEAGRNCAILFPAPGSAPAARL
jgi:diguanylate cyclase (GGDEF)-like protein/PAS domain S-box-containing protein